MIPGPGTKPVVWTLPHKWSLNSCMKEGIHEMNLCSSSVKKALEGRSKGLVMASSTHVLSLLTTGKRTRVGP